MLAEVHREQGQRNFAILRSWKWRVSSKQAMLVSLASVQMDRARAPARHFVTPKEEGEDAVGGGPQQLRRGGRLLCVHITGFLEPWKRTVLFGRITHPGGKMQAACFCWILCVVCVQGSVCVCVCVVLPFPSVYSWFGGILAIRLQDPLFVTSSVTLIHVISRKVFFDIIKVPTLFKYWLKRHKGRT